MKYFFVTDFICTIIGEHYCLYSFSFYVGKCGQRDYVTCSRSRNKSLVQLGIFSLWLSPSSGPFCLIIICTNIGFLAIQYFSNFWSSSCLQPYFILPCVRKCLVKAVIKSRLLGSLVTNCQLLELFGHCCHCWYIEVYSNI